MNKRRKFTWTNLQLEKLKIVREVLNDMEAFKPLTLRQVFYQLIMKSHLENHLSSYGMLSKLVKHGRIDGYIGWDEIEDKGRAFHDLTGWTNAQEFLNDSLKEFLTGYRRNLLQNQKAYLEIWIEKESLSEIFYKIAAKYSVRVVISGGFTSVSMLNDYKKRISMASGKHPVLLYFGNFDPSGVEMLKAMEITLRDEMGVKNIQYKRVALTAEQISYYELPHVPRQLKLTDRRAKKHIARFGELAVELDALSPVILKEIIVKAIESELDMRLFQKEQELYREELEKLSSVKKQIIKYGNETLPNNDRVLINL